LEQSGVVGHKKEEKKNSKVKGEVAEAMDVGTLALLPNLREFYG
jgi:hypothetical protein